MSAALRPRWRIEGPDKLFQAKFVQRRDELILRAGGELHALDAATGATRWTSVVDPVGYSGTFLHLTGDAIVTDRRPEPDRTTEVVVVRGQTVRGRYALDCVVGSNATAVVDDTLYAVGTDHATGTVFRGVGFETGERVVDVSLADIGATELTSFEGRFLIGNTWGDPGQYWLDRAGARAGVIEPLPSHFLQTSRGWLMAALRETEMPKRTIRVRELATGRIAWSAEGFGPHLAIDGDDAVHYDSATGVVLRDAATGSVRWHANVDEGELLSLRFAGPCVLVRRIEGFTVLSRATGTVLGEIDDGYSSCTDGPYLHVAGHGFVASFEIA